jgi:hypothetical protein
MAKNKENKQAEKISVIDSGLGNESVLFSDLLWVLVLNGTMLGLLLLLFYFNNQSHFIERWFLKVFNF